MAAGQQIDGSKGLTAFQAALWKYVARCALPEGQELTAPASEGRPLKFPGLLGLAPEWRDGTCNDSCQEKVSSCLIALMNRTGKHVAVSMLSGDRGMGKQLAPSETDLAFPHQEGAFFGNVFKGVAFACQGKDVLKAAQVKRFCAGEPTSCSGLSQFKSAGPCETACRSVCKPLSDGSQRCAAVSCQDPSGHEWSHPITIYLRNRLEAANADRMIGLPASDMGRMAQTGLVALRKKTALTFGAVDFGTVGQSPSTFAAQFRRMGRGGQLDVLLDGERRLGSLKIPPAGAGDASPREAAFTFEGIAGRHSLELRVVSGVDLGLLDTIEVR